MWYPALCGNGGLRVYLFPAICGQIRSISHRRGDKNLAPGGLQAISQSEHDNMQRLASALEELHAGIRVPNEAPVPLPADPRLLARAQIWNLATDAGDLDITAVPDGTDGSEDVRRVARSQDLGDGCTSRSPHSRTSSAARPPRAGRRISPQPAGRRRPGAWRALGG
jgi:hypothetical protein